MDAVITSADGTRLVVRQVPPSSAPGHGTPVVVLHGSGGGLHSWQPVAEALVDTHPVWLVARRGYGPSDVPDRTKSFADEVADVREVLASVRAETGRAAHLVGSSYGATLALHAGLAVREEIVTLCLYEPPLFAAGEELRPLLEDFRSRLASADLAGALSLLPRVSRIPPAVLAAFAGASSDPVPPEEVERSAIGWLHDLEAMAGDTTDVERWASLSMPILLLQGAESWDPIPATMDDLAHVLPRAQRTVWPGQSHFATSTAPQLVASTLRDFFRRCDKRTR